MKLDFGATSHAGGQYHRANKIVFSNPIEAQNNPASRSITFILEQVTNAATGGAVKVDAGFLVSGVPDETERQEMVSLIDLDGNVLGEIQMGQMMDATMLYINSFMIHAAGKQGRINRE